MVKRFRAEKQDDRYDEHSPFIVRKPYVRLWQMIFFGLFMTITIFGSIYYGNEAIRNFIVMLFGMLIIILMYFIQNTYFDEKTATEFQSSVYAGAMRSNTMLSFILYQDSNIFYFDQRYMQEFTGASRHHNFDHVMETLGVNSKTRERIVEAVRTSKFFEFEHKFFDGDKRSSAIIGVYPIQRPKGFSYLSVYRIRD
jgi:hypothetical protein